MVRHGTPEEGWTGRTLWVLAEVISVLAFTSSQFGYIMGCDKINGDSCKEIWGIVIILMAGWSVVIKDDCQA